MKKKATAGERFAMRWFNVTLRVLVAWEDGHKLAKAADILLARELARRVAELEAGRDRWKAIAEKRHEILRNLEWSSYDHDDEDYGSYCPCCTSMDDEAHVAGCKMAEAIAESSRAASGGQCYPFSTQTCDNPGCTCRAEKRDARAANERGEG